MRITPVTFATREVTVLSVDDVLKQVYVEFDIAHGAPAGMIVVISKAGTVIQDGLVGFVLAPPALDETKQGPFVGYIGADGLLTWTRGFYGSREPRRMTVCYGGNFDISADIVAGDTINISFYPPRSWGVDLLAQVSQTIQPSTVGCQPVYYA